MSKGRREARRAFYEKKEKEAYRLLKRMDIIGPLATGHYRGSQMIELEKPIRRGWIRFYKVREDLAKSKEGPALNQVLELVQSSARCDRKDFMNIGWGKKRKRELKPIEQRLAAISEKKYNELPEHLKRYFTRIDSISRWGGQKYSEYRVYPEWKFVFVVKPYYITRVPMTSSEAESEYELLKKKLFYHDMLSMKYMEHPSESKDLKNSQKSKRPNEKVKLKKEVVEVLSQKEQDEEDAYWARFDRE